MCRCREESSCSFSTAALSRAGRSSQRTRGSDCRPARPCEPPPGHRVAASGSSPVTSRACPDHRRDRPLSRHSSLSLKQIAGRRPAPPVSAGKKYTRDCSLRAPAGHCLSAPVTHRHATTTRHKRGGQENSTGGAPRNRNGLDIPARGPLTLGRAERPC